MKKFSYPVIIVLAAMLLLSACAPQAAQPAVVETNPQPEGLISSGRLLPVNSLAQSFALPGEVAEVLVKDGDVVEAGQVLARLSPAPEAQLALARAQQEQLAAQQALDGLQDAAEVTLAQARLARLAAEEELEAAQEDFDADDTDLNRAILDEASAQLRLAEETEAVLAKGNGVDPDQQAAFEARLASAEAALASAQAVVAAAELKASISGTVVDVVIQAGQKVTAGQPVFTLVDFSGWVVKTDNLTEVDVVQVQVGQQVEIVLDALPDQTLSAEVTHIGMLYEEKRGDVTYTVTARLNQTDPQMRWGMTAAVLFVP